MYKIGQIFEETYPPEAALWCNENNAYIEEIEPVENTRRFEVKAVPAPTLEEVRNGKLAELNSYFNKITETASLHSSLGFEIDANETANRNIDGLIKALQAEQIQEPVMFCDRNNEIQPVTLSQLETMQLEVILNGQLLYQKKWLVREKINACKTVEELEALDIEVEFNA